MTGNLFQEGGPHNVKRTGRDTYTAQVAIPPSDDGRVGRECPDAGCSPGYFKIKPGTGITGNQEVAFCPYCRQSGEPVIFHTKEQLRYAKDSLLREATLGVQQMLRQALGVGRGGKRTIGGGLLSVQVEVKAAQPPPVRRPVEEEVRRDVTCPNCRLDHSVYGLATWCADCGEDIFLTHVREELQVIRKMLNDVERRRAELGPRVAAKDLENCLEDTVSVFEAILRVMARRCLGARIGGADTQERFFRKVGNGFQNVDRARRVFREEFGIELFEGIDAAAVDDLAAAFEKRHPITHNLGVIDRKYLERARSAEREGREVSVTAAEIERALNTSLATFDSVYQRLETPMGT